jgi:hypothetical protein
MTVREAERVLSMKLHEDAGPDAEPGDCHYALSESDLPGIGFMVEDGKIVRIDVSKGSYRTTSGGHIGLTEDEIQALYPKIRTEPHPYDNVGHYLILTSPDQQFALLFETNGKVVTDFRIGKRDPVGYIERCL